MMEALECRPYPALAVGMGYDKLCFGRWLALAAVGGGLLTNYSVINHGYVPPKQCWEGISYFDGTTSPMIAADRVGAERIVEELISFVRRHRTQEGSQDMHCLTEFCWHNSAAGAVYVPNVLVEFPVRGPNVWGGPSPNLDFQRSPVVHYPRGTAHLVTGHERDWVGALQKLRPI
jgi:hypothetical protein